MRTLPPVRTVATLALLVALALPVAANISGPPPQAVDGHEVKTSDQGNPYATERLMVHVDTTNLTGPTKAYLPDVDSALNYWEQVDDPRVDWLETLHRTPAPQQADIVVEFHETGQLLLRTGSGEAPSLGLGTPGNATTPGQVDLTTRVGCTEIRRSHGQMEDLAKHEFGHALGLRHTEDPSDPMNHGGPFHGMPNPLAIALDSPNPLTGRVAGITAPLTAIPSCHLS